MELTPEQLDVINVDETKVSVVADAGSSKTTVLTHAVARRIEKGALPSNILVITFTREAAHELKTRLAALTPYADEIRIYTIHSFCLLLLMQHHLDIGFLCKPQLLSEEGQRTFFKNELSEFEIGGEEIVDDILNTYSYVKNTTGKFCDVANKLPEISRTVLQSIFKNYVAFKTSKNVIDFEDMLTKVNDMLEKSDSIRNRIKVQFDYVFVDEAQDTSVVQWKIISSISEKIFAVGDPKQSIYGWRGAVTDFDKRLGGVRKSLHQNFRSTPEIVAVANSIFPTGIFTLNRSGIKPIILACRNHAEETAIVAERAIEAARSQKSVAIVARNWNALKWIYAYLQLKGIQCAKASSILFDSKISLFCKLYLCALAPEKHWKTLCKLFSVKTVPPFLDTYRDDLLFSPKECFPISGQAGEKIMHLLQMKLEKCSAEVSVATFYEGFWVPFYGEHTMLASLQNYLTDWRLEVNEPSHLEHLNIVLSSVHGQKGKQYDAVFLTSLLDSEFPNSQSDDQEEEKRLFYVACTRARRELTMSYPRVDVKLRAANPSRFLSDLLTGELVTVEEAIVTTKQTEEVEVPF